jgi:hypothetical protein
MTGLNKPCAKSANSIIEYSANSLNMYSHLAKGDTVISDAMLHEED